MPSVLHVHLPKVGSFPRLSEAVRERFSWHQAQHLIEKHAEPVLSARLVQGGYDSELAVVINDTTLVKTLLLNC